MMFLLSVIAILLISYFCFDYILRSFKVGSNSDKYVFVTGCDSGFGKMLACKLDVQRFHVFAGCLTEDGRKYLKQHCSDRLVTLHLDVSENQSIEAALTEVERLLPEGKGLWGLVNNAGITGNFGIIELFNREDFYKVLDVNFLGMSEMTRHFLPLIRKARGRVVNMSSVAGRFASLGGAYTISKYGVEAYSDMLRGIKVIIIEPGAFQTDAVNLDTFKTSAEALFAQRSTEEMRECYGDMSKTYSKIYCKDSLIINKDISPVVDAYIHALTSRYPKTRYTVGWDAQLIYLPLSYLPTFISDRILALPYFKTTSG